MAYKLVKGRGLIPAENSPVAQPRTGDGVRARTGESILAATELPPEYFFGAHYQFDVDKRNFFIGEEPVGTACVRYNSEEFNNLPHSSEAYRFGNLEFASLGVAVGPNQFPGIASTTMSVSTPPGIEEIEIPKMDGDTITVAPPITVRMDYAYTPIPNSSLYYGRTETFVNGHSVATGSSNFTIGVSVELPSVHGLYTTESHAERQTYANAPFQLQDSFDVSSQVFARKLEFVDDFTPLEFTPGQPVTIANSFRWDSGPSDVVDAQWTVIVEDTLENQFTRFQEGTGTDISATFDLSDVLARGQVPRRYVLIPAGSPLEASIKQEQARLRARGEDIRAQTDVIPLTYRVIASAEAYPRSHVFPLVGSQFYQARYYAVNTQISPALRIRDINIDPNPFEPSPPEVAPEDRQLAIISAYVDAKGLGDGSYVVVHTQIYDQAGNVVKTFEDQNPIDYFELEWDGYDDEGNRLDPQEFLVELRAQVCNLNGSAREILAEISPQTLQLGSCSLTGDVAQAPGLLVASGGHLVEVFDSANRKVGSSSQTSSDKVAAKGSLRIEATGIQASAETVVNAVVSRLIETGSSGPIGMTNLDGRYTADFNPATLIVEKSSGGPLVPTGKTLFSEIRLGGTTGTFVSGFKEMMLGSDVIPKPPGEIYPSPLPVGEFLQDVSPRAATASIDNLTRTIGFETIEVSVDSAGRATGMVNVPRNPDVLLIALHGARGRSHHIKDLNGNLRPGTAEVLLGNGESLIPGPPGLAPPDRGVANFFPAELSPQLRTLVLSSCENADLHDFNNANPDITPLTKAADRNFPGEKWHQAIGGKVMLGYATEVSNNSVDAAFNRYGRELALLREVVPVEERQQLAWLSANFKAAKYGDGRRDQDNLDAVAWGPDYYYYIAYYRLDPSKPHPREWSTVIGFYRVPRSMWGNEPDRYEDNRLVWRDVPHDRYAESEPRHEPTVIQPRTLPGEPTP